MQDYVNHIRKAGELLTCLTETDYARLHVKYHTSIIPGS